MALTTSISQQELKRVAALSYEGKTVSVMLCAVGVSGFTSNSTVAQWETVEISGNGYARFTTTTGTGAYSTTDGRYNLPSFVAGFTATTGAGYIFDTCVIIIGGVLYPHSVITESPEISLLPGQSYSYRITLASDD